MASPVGYLKLWRSIKEWQWYSDVPVRTLFMHLLVEANWEEKPWKDQLVKPGSFITSTVALANEMGTNRASIHRSLRKLESTGEVNVQTNNHWTAITIVNWAKWQGKDDASERPLQHKRTSTERPVGTTKEDKKERSKEVTTSVVTARTTFDQFREQCLFVHREHKILSNAESKAFFDYWTEGHPDTKPRYATKDKFDIVKRMAYWKRREDERQTPAATPRSTTLKSWVQ